MGAKRDMAKRTLEGLRAKVAEYEAICDEHTPAQRLAIAEAAWLSCLRLNLGVRTGKSYLPGVPIIPTIPADVVLPPLTTSFQR